jgi:hypothetical protein
MRTRTIAIAIFCLSFWSLAWLSPQNPGNAQVITRLALAVQLVDQGRLDIGRFADWTVDQANFGGKIYADKTPGHPLLAVPAVAVARLVHQLGGFDADARHPAVFFDYAGWATLSTNVLGSALAAAVLFLGALQLGASRGGALFAAFTLALATPFFGWSTAFFAHSLAGSFLLFGFALILLILPAPDQPNIGPRPWLTALLGLVLSYACVIDLTAAPAVCVLGVFALQRARRRGQLGAFLVPLLAGGIFGALPLIIYNQLAFGSPLHLGYENTSFEGMQRGFFGVTWPSPVVLVQLLVGLYRGLLPLAPVLALVPFGIAAMARRGRSGPALVVALVVLLYFWINSSYYYWNGGFSLGPRHLVAMLPMAAISLAFVWPATAGEKFGVSILLGLSLIVSLACAAAGMFPPDTLMNPLAEWVLPQLFGNGAWVKGVIVLPAWLGFAALLYAADRKVGERLKTGSAAVPLGSAE